MHTNNRVHIGTPLWRTTGTLQGHVSCLTPLSTYAVAVYIQVANGWWTKPTFAAPLTPIQPNGSWSTRTVTGGSDYHATVFAAFVVPASYSPPAASGNPELPSQLYTDAVTYSSVERTRLTLNWSGYVWNVKSSDTPVGPGPNYFSDSPQNVWVDGSGALHLKSALENGVWYSAEIFSQMPLGYGMYSFQCSVNDLQHLDSNVVLGLFTWETVTPPEVHHREIDTEFSRWSNAADSNFIQYVVQPWDHAGNLHRFQASTSPDPTPPLCNFTWRLGSVEFQITQGSTVLEHWLYQGADVPPEGRGNARLNLWLYNGTPPSDGQAAEVIIKDFHFTPIGDTLALYNTSTGATSLIDTLQDSPPAAHYNTYTSNAPVVGSSWVMGDWDGDGQKTPGVYKNGAFFYTNSIGSSVSWTGVWLGWLQVSPVAGRFDSTVNHDCFGVVELDFTPSGFGFPLHYTCNLSAGSHPISGQWLGIVLPGTDPYQFVVGDWNNDGLDSVAARRGVYISWGNVPPANGVASFPLAQYIGAPHAGTGALVAGDWDNNQIDSFGLYYSSDGTFYRRNDLDWNSGVYYLQHVGLPIGAAVPASWRKEITPSSFSLSLPITPPSLIPTATPTELPTEIPMELPILTQIQVELDAPQVVRSGEWTALTEPEGASGGSYLINSSPEAALTLRFIGTSARVVYVTGPSFGQFTLLVDGVAQQMVTSQADDYGVGGQAMVSGLSDGAHELQIVPMNGVAAIDAFIVTQVLDPLVQPTLEPTSTETETPAPLPTVVPTDQPSAEPTAEPTELPSAKPPTPTATLEPLALPVAASMDDGAPDWQIGSGWVLATQFAYGDQGLGWGVPAANQTDMLRWDRQLDLRTVVPGQAVQLSYQSLLTSTQSTAEVQVSGDGVNWVTVGAAASWAKWATETIDLSAYAGQLLQVQFVWTGVAPTGEGQSADTWQIDAVTVVTVVPTSVPTPTDTATEIVAPTTPPTEPVFMPTGEATQPDSPTATDTPDGAPVQFS